MSLSIGCHVSASGGVWNAPKNAHDFGCETFQLFTRSPQGGKAPELDPDAVDRFKEEMERFGYSYRYGSDGPPFVVHCPYFVNFGSGNNRIYHGSISVVKQELERSSMLGAQYMMTHLGTFTDIGEKEAIKQAKEGLTKVLEAYEGSTQFLLEISAGSGNTLGDTYEELAELMEPLVKFKTFGGICFDTQHAFASGYDLRTPEAVTDTFKKFDKIIGLKYLKMSHVNDSKIDLGGRKDRHEHIGDGLIGKKGFTALLDYLQSNLKSKILNPKSGVALPLILETKHDTVEKDIKVLKTIREKITK